MSSHQPPATLNPTAAIRLMIVEDEYILAVNLQESLEALGYTVVDIVDTAEMAIAKAAEHRPNLILMDIRLRGAMDGIQAAAQIWQQFQIPVIYLTGHSDQSTVERATHTSPFGYILKPVRDKELYVAIQTALSRYEREHFLNTILQGMGDAVMVVDTALQVSYLNAVAEQLTGWRLPEARSRLGTEVVQLIDEATQSPIDHPICLALHQGKTIQLSAPTLLVAKDGSTLPIAETATPLNDHQGNRTGVVLVFRDDTPRRLAESHRLALDRAQQMEVQLQEIKKLNDLKNDFLDTTSHELRTPLSNIKMAIYMLEVTLNQLKAEHPAKTLSIDHYLTVLREQCDQELALVNDLLEMRSYESGDCPLTPTAISLQDWLPHLAENFHDRIQTQEQTLTITAPPDFPPIVSDLSGFTRIMSELLNNACKYTPPQERIQVIVQWMGDPLDPMLAGAQVLPALPVQILIRNSGVDIPADQLSHIFDPFHRIPSHDPWKYGGTGLGLALVKKLIRHLQGTIAVSNRQGWMTFTLNLPLTLSSSGEEPG